MSLPLTIFDMDLLRWNRSREYVEKYFDLLLSFGQETDVYK